MSKKNRFQRKNSTTDPNSSFVSPLLRQDDTTTTNNYKVIFDFPPNQPNNFKVGNQDSEVFKNKSSRGINLVHSLLLQPGTNSNVPFNFPNIQPEVIVPQTSETVKEMKVLPVIPRPLLSTRPITELLEPTSKPPENSTKEQNTEKEKSPVEIIKKSKLSNDSTENNQIKQVDPQVENVPDLVKNEPKIINSDSSEESSSCTDEDDELCEILNVNDTVIMVDDSEGENMDNEQETDNNQSSPLEEDILLDDSEVYRMDLSQELDINLQIKENLVDIYKRQIFIGNLPPLMNKLHLAKFFQRYGTIVNLKFIRSKGHNKLICFLTYEDAKSAENALETNGLFYRGRNFRVASVGRKPVVVNSTILVTNLPNDTSTQDLYKLFEVCGPVKSQYLVKENGTLLAYITFEMKISAKYAILLKDFAIRGKELQISKYKNQRENQGLSNLIS